MTGWAVGVKQRSDTVHLLVALCSAINDYSSHCSITKQMSLRSTKQSTHDTLLPSFFHLYPLLPSISTISSHVFITVHCSYPFPLSLHSSHCYLSSIFWLMKILRVYVSNMHAIHPLPSFHPFSLHDISSDWQQRCLKCLRRSLFTDPSCSDRVGQLSLYSSLFYSILLYSNCCCHRILSYHLISYRIMSYQIQIHLRHKMKSHRRIKSHHILPRTHARLYNT